MTSLPSIMNVVQEKYLVIFLVLVAMWTMSSLQYELALKSLFYLGKSIAIPSYKTVDNFLRDLQGIIRNIRPDAGFPTSALAMSHVVINSLHDLKVSQTHANFKSLVSCIKISNSPTAIAVNSVTNIIYVVNK